MRRFVLLVAGLALLAGFAATVSGGATQAETRWVITDLGTLGGVWSVPAGWTHESKTGLYVGSKPPWGRPINERGQIIGTTCAQTCVWAFLWQNGKMRNIGAFEAVAINDHSQVVGGDGSHAFVWKDGALKKLPSLGKRSFAFDINERGQIVGWSGGNWRRAVLWEKGKAIALPPLRSARRSEARAINERGQIVGTSGDHAVRWENGEVTDLGTLRGGYASEARAINERGQIIGHSWNPMRAVLWQGRAATRLSSTRSFAYAINGSGQVVGETDIFSAFLWQSGKMLKLGAGIAFDINERGQVVGATGGKNMHAALWENGKLTGLGALPGWEESGAVAISASGQIVGWSSLPSSVLLPGEETVHAVLWTLKR